jgi:hypothetical protein
MKLQRWDLYVDDEEPSEDGYWVKADDALEAVEAARAEGRREALAELGLEEAP